MAPDASNHMHTTWKKYAVMQLGVEQLQVKSKRTIFHTWRTTPDVVHESLMPCIGLTMSEFAFFQVLGEHRKKKPVPRSAT